MDISIEDTLTRRWVLVAGTGGRFGLSHYEQVCSKSIGRILAENRFGLVTGGWDGVDYLVTEAFVNELIRQEIDPDEYVIHVLPEDWEPHHLFGRVVRIPPGGREWLEPQQFAEAVILIGGRGGTYRAWLSALHGGLPRFPIGGTGGDAKQAFLDNRDLWEVMPILGISRQDFEVIGKGISSESDAEQISSYIVSNLLIRSLNAVDAVSRRDIVATPSMFISYSRKDMDWVMRIRTLMRPVERRGLISTWVDADMRAGEYWESQITSKISSSDLALLLVSKNLLSSRYVREVEIPAFLMRKKNDDRFLLYWLLIEPCDWHSLPVIDKFQSIGSTDLAVSESVTKADEQCRLVDAVNIITRSILIRS